MRLNDDIEQEISYFDITLILQPKFHDPDIVISF